MRQIADGPQVLQIVGAEADLLACVGEHGLEWLFPGRQAAGSRGGPQERIAADRGAAELEKGHALGALDEELDAEGKPEAIGEGRLLEDDEGLGIASGATEDRAFRRDSVGERDRTVEAPRRACERHPRVGDCVRDGRIERESEGIGPKRRLAVDEGELRARS